MKLSYPEMIRIRQVLDVPRVENIEETVDRELVSLNGFGIKQGDRIAVTAGSRGVANIVRILRRVVQKVREAGGEPFLIPTMGSHGGGTAEGQIDVLRSLGVTEESTGAPIRSSME